MASTLNAKTVHKDGKTELKIGLDKDSKILEGHEGTLTIKNADGSDAKIARENIPSKVTSATLRASDDRSSLTDNNPASVFSVAGTAVYAVPLLYKAPISCSFV